MDVSIIIVNYNTKGFTDACISSIIQHTHGLRYEIILVDNDSSDGSKEYFSMDNRVIFHECGINVGFGSANNQGLTHCHGKYIFLLNSDTLLKDNIIKSMFDKMESLNDDIAVLGTHLINGNGKACHSYSTFPSISKCLKELYGLYFRKTVFYEDPGYEGIVDYITGADMFIRKSVIDRHGFFDPDFFMYFEESHLQYRLRSFGKFSYIFNGGTIVHLEGGSASGTHTARQWKMYFAGMFTFMRKRYTGIMYIIFRMIAPLYLPIIIKAQYSSSDRRSLIKLFFSFKY